MMARLGLKERIHVTPKLIMSVVISLITFFTVVCLPNDISSLQYIGYALILCSALFFFRYRKNSNLALFIGIIIAINICLALSVCLNPFGTAFNWQVQLVDSFANITNAKNYLLFVNVLCLAVGEVKAEKSVVEIRKNSVLATLLFVGLVFILIFGFDRGEIGTYTSNANALYEYALVAFIFAWKYSPNRYFRLALIFYAMLYIGQGLVFGDRSSAFPMILLLFMLIYRKKVKTFMVLLLGLGGIFIANVVDVFRNAHGEISFDILGRAASRGLFVNTISYAFYGGTQVINLALNSANHLTHFFNYAASLVLGGSNQYSLTVMANANKFVNKGGGMSHAYFYYWGGFIATVLFAILMGRIINKIFNSRSELCAILRVTVTIFLIRWMLYYPVAFFRSALLIPVAAFVVLSFIDGRMRRLRR